MNANEKKLLKRAVGKAAAARVESGMILGLGTGTTAEQAILALAGRLERGEIDRIRGVPTSYQAAFLARDAGIPLVASEEIDRIDLAIDGADEVDSTLNLIKGGGGAHTREKLVASLAETFLVIVDEEKMVERLGAGAPVPVEVLPLAYSSVLRVLRGMGAEATLRQASRKSGPVVTDLGNLLIDAKFEDIPDAADLERELNNIPGVVDNGIFAGMADLVLVGAWAEGEPRIRELKRSL